MSKYVSVDGYSANVAQLPAGQATIVLQTETVETTGPNTANISVSGVTYNLQLFANSVTYNE